MFIEWRGGTKPYHQARLHMKGKTVVITGGTSGIGEVAAEALARMGARIVLVGRNKARVEAISARLRRSGPGVAHSVYFADLTRLGDMKRVAAEIAAREPPIDVLINNAGALFGMRRLTEDGLEYTFALNHMSYFVLTCASGFWLPEPHASSVQLPQRIRAPLWISTICNPRRASEP